MVAEGRLTWLAPFPLQEPGFDFFTLPVKGIFRIILHWPQQFLGRAQNSSLGDACSHLQQ